MECPKGLQFGVDTDKYKAADKSTVCDSCPEDTWKACAKEGQRLRETNKQEVNTMKKMKLKDFNKFQKAIMACVEAEVAIATKKCSDGATLDFHRFEDDLDELLGGLLGKLAEV